MRVWTGSDIFTRIGNGEPCPTEYVARKDHEREVQIARQVGDDGLPLHYPTLGEGGDAKWSCRCGDEKCAWNVTLERAETTGFLHAVRVLLDTLNEIEEEEKP